MWKRLLIALVILILAVGGLGIYLSNQIYLRHDHQAVGPGEYDLPLSPAEIRADVEYLIAKLRKIHPSFDAIGGLEYERSSRALVAGITEPMTRIELYRELAPLNGLLTDGHTSLRSPAEEHDAYLAADGRSLPFTVRLIVDEVVVDGVLADELDMQAGDRLTEINGISAAALAEFSVASQSGESIELRRAYAQRFFARELWARGVASPFEIGLLRNGEPLTVGHPGVTREAYLAQRDEGTAGENAYRVLEPGIGLLTFNDMPPADAEFREFLETTFAAIREDGVGALIVDIRDNGGGDSRAGDALMAYLADRDLPAIDHVEVHVTDEIKDYYETLLPPGFRWIPLDRFVEVLEKIRTTESGESFTLRPDAAEPAEWGSRQKNAFEGELIVLAGPRTYSSAVIFGAPLKHFGRATFVGAETGEPLIFFGENYYFDLPNSKLEAQVSHKKFVLVGATDERTGIVPDVGLTDSGQDALAVALDVASGSYAATPGDANRRDVGSLLERFDAVSSKMLFDPRIIESGEWSVFREAFEESARQAGNDRELLAAFDDALAASPLFSHFELRIDQEAAGPGSTVPAPGERISFEPADDRTAVLTIPSFSGDAVSADIDAAFDEAIAAGVETLVVDLRGNPGGTFAAWPLVARLTPRTVAAGYLVGGKWYLGHDAPPTPADLAAAVPTTTADRDVLVADLMDDGLLVLGIEPELPTFGGDVFVRIDERTASTSEIVAGVLQFNDLADIVGETSAGEVLNAELFPLGGGLTLLLPIADFYLPDGTRLEGRGVTPDAAALRVTVGEVVGLLGAGRTTDEVLRAYPYLEREDILQALSHAAWRLEEVEVPVGSA